MMMGNSRARENGQNGCESNAQAFVPLEHGIVAFVFIYLMVTVSFAMKYSIQFFIRCTFKHFIYHLMYLQIRPTATGLVLSSKIEARVMY